MKIILEGVDGSGKTTLAKIFANEYGLEYCHCTANDPSDYEFYLNTSRKENVVWDRHTIGELVYPMVFHRPAQVGTEDVRLILAHARENNTKIFVLTADMETIRNRLEKRGGEHPLIMENLEYINDTFLFYAKEFNVPVIDTSCLTLNQLFDLVNNYPKIKFIH